MLSLRGAFQVATRRQIPTAHAVTTRSLSAIRHLQEIIHEASEAGNAVEEDGIIDSVPGTSISRPLSSPSHPVS